MYRARRPVLGAQVPSGPTDGLLGYTQRNSEFLGPHDRG